MSYIYYQEGLRLMRDLEQFLYTSFVGSDALEQGLRPAFPAYQLGVPLELPMTDYLRRQHLEVLDYRDQLASWEQQNLPNPDSRVARDLFRAIGRAWLLECSLNIKEAALFTGHSEGAVRQQLKLFVEEGWVKKNKPMPDQRFTVIQPTDQFTAIHIRWLEWHLRVALPYKAVGFTCDGGRGGF